MKRAAEGHGDDGRRRGPKQGRAGKFGPHALKILCPEVLVAKLVGNKGSLIHQIEDQTKSHLQFSPRGEYYPGTQLRILTIFAEETQIINEVLTLILDETIVTEDQEGENKQGRGSGDFVEDKDGTVFRCAFSKAAAGAVIGTKGERVKGLRETTGAHIEVVREVVDSHQMIILGGEREQVLAALEELNQIAQEDVDKPWFSEWAAQRSIRSEGGGGGGAGGQGGSRRGRGGAGGGISNRDHVRKECTVFVGRLSQATDAGSLRSHFSRWGKVVEADTRMDNKTGRSKGFGFVTFSSPDEVEDCLASMDEHTIDGRGVDVKRYGEDGDERPPPSERDNPMPPESRDRELRGRDDDRHAEPPRRAPPRHGDVGTVQWLVNLAEAVPPEFLGYDYCISCSLPSAKCGTLIGRRGEHITGVERATGTSVSVSKKDPMEGPDAHRQITVQGPMLQVYSAHMLLMKHYNEEERRFQDRERGSGGGGAGGGSEENPQGKIQALEKQLAELSQSLARITGGGGKVGGKGGGKGGKRGKR